MRVRMLSFLGATFFAAFGYKLNIGAVKIENLFYFTVLGAIVGGFAGWCLKCWWKDL